MKNTILPLLLTTTFAACTSTGTDTSISQAPTSSGGYAGSAGNADPGAITLNTNISFLYDVNVTTDDNTIRYINDGDFEIEITNQQFDAETGDLISFDIVPNSRDDFLASLTWNEANRRYEGFDMYGSTYYWYERFSSNDNALALYWFNSVYEDVVVNGAETNGEDFGSALIGINSSPTDVAARTNSATYAGTGIIELLRADDGAKTYGEGDVTLTADFTAGTIGGQITNIENASSYNTAGYNIADGAVVTIEQATIDGNAFALDISIDAADFGLSANDDITGLGQFYGEDAANVGGTFSGAGTDSTDDGTVFITGGFGAQETQE